MKEITQNTLASRVSRALFLSPPPHLCCLVRWKSVDDQAELPIGPDKRPLRHFRVGGYGEQSVLEAFVSKR